LLNRKEGVEYFAEHREGFFYVVSNHQRPDFAVYLLSDDQLDEVAGWPQLELFFQPQGGFHVTDVDLLADSLVLYGNEAAAPRICVVPLRSKGDCDTYALSSYLVELPSCVGSVEPGVNAEPAAGEIRFTFRSPLDPGTTYRLELHTRNISAIGHTAWSGGPNFKCERFEYPARDGEMVPLTVVRPRTRTGPQPCLLHVYGAYGTCLMPDFRPQHISLLRRGWAIAWAHVRGGGERGRAWHDAARQGNKVQSVWDLADAVSFLLARDLVTPGLLCVKASSAGGLTLGAVLNAPMISERISAAIMEVPFVDVVAGMSDTSLPLTVHEFSEWGDPREQEHERNLRTLSPYENVGTHPYPALYLSCALGDARVPAWMPLKYAARIRARSAGFLGSGTGRVRTRRAAQNVDVDVSPRVFVSWSDSGHGGASDWHGHSQEFARQVAFLFQILRLPQN